MCIDCGANVGLISDIFLKLGATCYAFEPSRDCIKILKHKFYKNNKFKLIPAAVSNRNGEVTLIRTSSFDQGANTVNYYNDDAKIIKYTIKAIRLSDFIKDLLKTTNNICLLKLDIEGAEFDVLEDLIKREFTNRLSILSAKHTNTLAKN
ncbi:MAG: FkbM family methyltransferase [Endomicrobium sp.]|uniref:FkbM family methyltransferase n=1 Tax=Candidatus Endomicrobiellum pyrsonymphae TaxID=1408203 RepID=UPI00357CAF60|nr:FkbM family methyltransferase [Endomicrobium sp.]